ncbi:hypothetical protein K1W54_10395 [Micromonospora sp. CPCC 205371]|nr:hypothetical protein [Micromonospora sp. CPCC 205371]
MTSDATSSNENARKIHGQLLGHSAGIAAMAVIGMLILKRSSKFERMFRAAAVRSEKRATRSFAWGLAFSVVTGLLIERLIG